MGYAKLFSSITESSLWSEPKEVRLLFVTMLAKANSIGFVEAAIPGLARAANLALKEVERAITILENPDPFSKNPECEGRRIIAAPGGWIVLNYEEYRSRQSEEERREYMREYMQNYRKQAVNNVKPGKESPSASSSVSVSDGEKKKSRPENQTEVEAFCVSIGLLKSDGEAMWLDWQDRGFGKTKDWKAKIRRWKIHGYHPSQKQRKNGARPDNPKPVDRSKIDLPERFKSWASTKFPAKRDEIMKWQTWADAPNSLRQEWWREEKQTLAVGHLI